MKRFLLPQHNAFTNHKSVTKIYITKPQQIRLLNTLYIATCNNENEIGCMKKKKNDKEIKTMKIKIIFVSIIY